MDNLCHTLTGAALGEAGLKRATRFGGAALMVAANLPDVDVLAFLSATPPVALRRGWTHGILAQALLPMVLTAGLMVLDRWRPPRRPGVPRVRAGAMLMLGYIGVLSHVGMDWLNNYGVRLLMPWSGRWFYGDAVFIVDPWLWLTLAAGVVAARRSDGVRPARVALIIASVYIAGMVASAGAARQRVWDAWTQAHGRPPAALMVGPVLISPLRKTVIVDAGRHYERGTFSWRSGQVQFEPRHVPKRDDEAAPLGARTHPEFRALLVWARFPYYEMTTVDGGTRVTLADMRFGPSLFRATTVVP